MENSGLKTRILMEIEKIISRSSAKKKMTKKMQEFHTAIIKKHYNATDVKIDYHRHRVMMNVVLNDERYKPEEVNVAMEVLPMNMFFKSLSAFLKSCLDSDAKSIAFYAKLIKEFATPRTHQLTY